MLEKCTYDDLPKSRGVNLNSKFAEKCIEDFIELNCDAVKVSGWPLKRDTRALVATMNAAVKRKGESHRVRVHRGEDIVFLSRRR